MTLKNAIYYTAMLLQLDDTLSALENGEIDEEALRLIRLANLVISEIATEYYPLKAEVIIKTNDEGEIAYDAFPTRPIEIYRAENGFGVSVPFSLLSDAVVMNKAGEYTFTYSYAPPLLELEDELPFPTKITERIVAYGTACEYCLISGMNEEAVTWDRRYKDAVTEAVYPKTEKRVKARWWR